MKITESDRQEAIAKFLEDTNMDGNNQSAKQRTAE